MWGTLDICKTTEIGENMNLMTSAWVPVIHQDGTKELIAPWQIAETDNPVIDINAPRPDFQGGLYQFLIGLLQTSFAPEDEDQWLEYWEATPTTDELKESFEKLAFAFELNNPGDVAFMQDLELSDGKEESIELLLIGAPGGNTITKNIDLFQKRHQFQKLCSSCAASALFTLQTNGPPGGSGHMAGLRGNGPITTLVMPENRDKKSLFQCLWLNVLPKENANETDDAHKTNIFPWFSKTRLSKSCTTKQCQEGCPKCGTYPSNVDLLHAYWSMPRRIRLVKTSDPCKCDICSIETDQPYKSYITKPKGYRYVGGWVHPLTPYQWAKEKLPNPIKGQKSGLSYQHWNGLVLQDTTNNYHAAKVVEYFIAERALQIGQSQVASLWCFGYDMEPGQAKARCWYESHFPVFYMDEKQKNNLMDWGAELINSAREVVKILRTQVKEAWFRRPKDVKGDMSSIDMQFWQATETGFYNILEQLAALPGETGMAPAEIYQAWFKTLEKQVFQVFETATLESNPEDLDLKRIISAQNELRKKFYSNKTIKNLKLKATPKETEK